MAVHCAAEHKWTNTRLMIRCSFAQPDPCLHLVHQFQGMPAVSRTSPEHGDI
jgi:hypothetical protein